MCVYVSRTKRSTVGAGGRGVKRGYGMHESAGRPRIFVSLFNLN